MKSTLTLPTEVLYNPSSALANSWYGQPLSSVRRKHTTLPPLILEPDSRKQEIVCSVIFVLCLLFSIGICFGQLALS